ncbi:hypothetical protein V2G26_016904 [Clonostachys chloroleuca]
MLATAVFNLRSNILFFYPSIKRHQNCVSVLCGSPNWQPTFPFATRSPTCGKHLHGWTEVSLIAGSLAVDLNDLEPDRTIAPHNPHSSSKSAAKYILGSYSLAWILGNSAA